MLKVENLSVNIRRRRNVFTAVDGSDFSLNAGEIAALVGESGCGKTLTALSIMRLLPPAVEISGGSILWESSSDSRSLIPLHSLDEKSLCKIRGKEISMIFQEPRQSLNPLMRIGKQIAETLTLHGADKKTAFEQAMFMLHKLKLPDPEKILNARPFQLSGGMCQRVMIAVAAICRPRLLIADEPTSSLDTETRRHIMNLLQQINNELGTAVLFITHDLLAARNFCNRFLIMYAGKIIEEGPAEKIFSSPAHPYTEKLMSAIPRKENRGQPLANIPGMMPSVENRLGGCPFAPRCQRVRDCCRTAFPPQTDLGGGHKVSCFVFGGGNG